MSEAGPKLLCPDLSEDRAGMLQLWDHPLNRREYVIGADVAEGRQRDRGSVGRRKMNYVDSRPDYSAAVVLELETGLHVGTWHGYLPPDEFAVVLAALGMHFNEALLVVELNGPGLAVVTRLAETLRYPNLYRTKTFNVYSQDPWRPQFGWQTTPANRHLLINRIHEVLNTRSLFTRDKQLVSELRTVEFDDAGTPRSKGKNKDDRVLAFGMALQGRYEMMVGTEGKRQAGRSDERAFDEMVWQKIRNQQERSEHGDGSSRFGDRGIRSGWRGPMPAR